MSQICFTLPDSDQKVCIQIPDLIRPLWPFPPEVIHKLTDLVKGPSPEPWIQGLGIKAELARDIQVLASAHALADSMSGGAGRALQEAIRLQVGNIKLPGGLKINLGTAAH